MKKALDIIKKTVQIFDQVSYKNYSDGKAKTYFEYMEGYRADEDKLISPILLRKFLEEILGFKLGATMATQESKAVGKPDYVSVDTRTHPFVFDAKGTDTQYLSQHYPQIKKYIESQGLKYGILTNMRDLDVYTSEEKKEKEEYNFNFINLYQDYKQNPIACLEEENTKHFLNFIETFSYTSLTKEEKIERIAKAKPWSGKEELDTRLLTDKLRHVVSILHNDVKQQKSELISIAEVGKVSAVFIAYEIENISSQISGREIMEVNSRTFSEIMNASDETSYVKGRDAFFRRVAYFAMTRLLLARVWEDIGFIEQSLYNGGFAKWYENFNREIRRVLHYAFDLSAERYPWLFNVNNNYSWYDPSDDALIESLYELSNFYLGKLDQDILGTIYEDYIEKVDKKNKGQYYTPREIVSFIWDRVGYNNPKAFFWHTERGRRPNFIFDPATGSGGFLVEAAKRIRECPEFDWDDPQDLKDMHNAILWGIFGSEISPFPYYLTQVNLLIQLTPVIKRILELTGKKPRESPTPLGIICEDSMKLHNHEPSLLPVEIKEEKEEYQRKILHFTIAEKKIYEKIKDEYAGKFSYCCANPPYVGEKGRKELFRHTVKAYPYWNTYYQGKMDYLHWFVILGLSKLRDYGKLGFIISAYWPTADGASKLRKYILENAKIKETIFFEEVKIFEHAKGQHNMIFILTKCSGKEHKGERENNHIKIVRVKCKNQDLPGNTIRENLDFLTKHIQKFIDKPRYQDEYIKVFWSGIKQGELTDAPWDLLFDTNTRKTIDKISANGSPLEKLCNVIKGVDTGANCVTKENIRDIRAGSARLGEGIFILSAEELRNLSLTDEEKTKIKPLITSEDLGNGILDIVTQPNYLLYVKDKDKLENYPRIYDHLAKFRGILESRAEIKRNPGRKWYALAWPRDESVFEDEKLIVSYRADRNNFVFDRSGYFGLSGLYFIAKENDVGESLEYIMALLNSKTIDFWYGFKGKKKGDSREYVETPINSIPIRHIDFNNSEDVRMHDEIVEKVKSTMKKMAELAKYSKYFSGPKLTKLEFNSHLPEINDEAIIKSIPPENLYNLRIHPEMKIEKPKDFEEEKFYLNKVDKPELTLTGNFQIKLKGKDGTTVFIEGPHDLLKLLVDILSDWKGKPWREIKEDLLLPDNIVSFNAQKTRILSEVQGIRTEISQFQKEIDQIVCKLYRLGVPEIKMMEGLDEKGQ